MGFGLRVLRIGSRAYPERSWTYKKGPCEISVRFKCAQYGVPCRFGGGALHPQAKAPFCQKPSRPLHGYCSKLESPFNPCYRLRGSGSSLRVRARMWCGIYYKRHYNSSSTKKTYQTPNGTKGSCVPQTQKP